MNMNTIFDTGLTIGHVAGFDIFVAGDVVTVMLGKEIVTKQEGNGLGKWLAGHQGHVSLGWAETEDFNIIYLYDKADGNFGYAVNVEAPDCSEWGYAPFQVKEGGPS